MRNFLKCSSFIRMAIIIVVMAFLAGQVAETYATNNNNNNNKQCKKGNHKPNKKGNKCKTCKKKIVKKITKIIINNNTSGGGSTNHQDVCCDEILGKLDDINSKIDGNGECTGALPKTGQVKTKGERDDGVLRRGVEWPNPRFTDNEDGTITDNLTCLIWDKDANRFEKRSWDDALSDCNTLDATDDDANGNTLDDGSVEGEWRLPNRLELASLLHLGYVQPAVPNTAGTGKWTTNGDPFNDVISELYWSSTNDAWPHTDGRWYVSMNGGTVNGEDDTTTQYRVWCVKGGK